MVQLREDQINVITVLGGTSGSTQPSSPGVNSIWINDDSPSLPKFTDSAGTVITLGSGTQDVYDNFVDLRAATPINGELVILKSHTVAGLGGGTFRGVTGAAPGTYVDNNGNIAENGTGTAAWLRVDPQFYPEDFGAIGNNTANDSAAFQAVFNSTASGTIQGRTGAIYRLQSTLNLSYRINTQFLGNKCTINFVLGAVGGNAIDMSRTNRVSFYDCNINADSLFNGTLVNCTGDDLLGPSYYVQFERCVFTGPTTCKGVDFNGGLLYALDDCTFIGFTVCIDMKTVNFSNVGRFSNVITRGYLTCGYHNPGDAITWINCTFGPNNLDKGGRAVLQDVGRSGFGWDFQGCWAGDGSADLVAFVELHGFVYGLNMHGNTFYATGGCSALLSDTGSINGVSITGNSFTGSSGLDINIAIGYGVDVAANSTPGGISISGSQSSIRNQYGSDDFINNFVCSNFAAGLNGLGYGGIRMLGAHASSIPLGGPAYVIHALSDGVHGQGSIALGPNTLPVVWATARVSLDVLNGITGAAELGLQVHKTGMSWHQAAPFVPQNAAIGAADLGSTSARWNKAWLDEMDVGGVTYPTAVGSIGQTLTLNAPGSLSFTSSGGLLVSGLVADNNSSPIANANATIMQTYAALNMPLMVPDGLYYISSGFELTRPLRGAGEVPGSGTQFRATAAMPWLCRVVTSSVVIDGICFHGDLLANHCIEIFNGGYANIKNVRCYWSRLDGIHAPISGNNIGVLFEKVGAINCGRRESTGTATGTSSIVTFTGSPNLTTLGIRLGVDSVTFGSELTQASANGFVAYVHEISAVTATTLEIYPSLEYAISGSTFSINMGSGMCFEAHGDNGSHVLVDCLFQNSADAGFREMGLFGSREYGTIYENNNVGHIIGAFVNVGSDVQWSRSDSPYFENNTYGDYIVQRGGKSQLTLGFIDAPANLKIRAYPGADYPNVTSPFQIFYTPIGVTSTLTPENNFGRVTRFTANHNITVQSHSFRAYLTGANYELYVETGTLTVTAFPGVTIANLSGGTFTPGTNITLRCIGTNVWEIVGSVLDEYPTMAASRLVDPVNGRRSITKGFASAGDGGGGEWIEFTGAAPGTYVHNGGTVIVPIAGNGSAAKIRQGWTEVDPRWFFVSNGITDVTAALQAMFDALPNNTTFRFPRGGEYVHGTINLTGRTGLRLFGDKSTFIFAGTTGTVGFDCTRTLDQEFHNLRFIVGAGVPSHILHIAGDDVLGVSGGTQITNCRFVAPAGTSSSINFAGVVTAAVTTCSINGGIAGTRGSSPFSIGIYIDRVNTVDQVLAGHCNPSTNWSFHGCVAQRRSDGGSGFIDQQTAVPQSCAGISIVACWMGDGQDPTRAWINFESHVSGLSMHGCFTYTFGAPIIHLTGSGEGWEVSGNHFAGPVISITVANLTGARFGGNHWGGHTAPITFGVGCTNCELGPLYAGLSLSTDLHISPTALGPGGRGYGGIEVRGAWEPEAPVPSGDGPALIAHALAVTGIGQGSLIFVPNRFGSVQAVAAIELMVKNSGVVERGLSVLNNNMSWHRPGAFLPAGAAVGTANIGASGARWNKAFLDELQVGGVDYGLASVLTANPSGSDVGMINPGDIGMNNKEIYDVNTITQTSGGIDQYCPGPLVRQNVTGTTSPVFDAAWYAQTAGFAVQGGYRQCAYEVSAPSGMRVLWPTATPSLPGVGGIMAVTSVAGSTVTMGWQGDVLNARSADGKVTVERTTPGAATDSASLANAATLHLSYTTATNRDHALMAVVKMTVASVRYVVRLAIDAENVAGTVAVLGQQVLGSLPVGVTLVADVSGTAVRAALLNSTGSAIGPIRMRWSRATVEDPS